MTSLKDGKKALGSFKTMILGTNAIQNNIFTIKMSRKDVFSSRLSHGTCYKWLHCKRKQCFDKNVFLTFYWNHQVAETVNNWSADG